MLNYIIILIAGVFLAQCFVASLAIWQWQKRNNNIKYPKAAEIYFTENLGRYVVVAVCTFILCFLLADYLDLSISRAELLAKNETVKLSRIELIQLRFRTFTVAIGAFVEVIAVIAYKKGLSKILEYNNSIDTNDKRNT